MKCKVIKVNSKTVIVRTTRGFRVRHYDAAGNCDMESGLILEGRRRDGTLELLIARKVSEGAPRKWVFPVEPDYRLGIADIIDFTAEFDVELNGSRIM